jgi:hypothetical protein
MTPVAKAFAAAAAQPNDLLLICKALSTSL